MAGKNVSRYLEGTGHLLASSLNLAEVYLKVLREESGGIAESCAEFMKRLCEIVGVDEDLAAEAVKEKFSSGLGIVDAIITATTRKKGAEILTGDKHFKNLENVIFFG